MLANMICPPVLGSLRVSGAQCHDDAAVGGGGDQHDLSVGCILEDRDTGEITEQFSFLHHLSLDLAAGILRRDDLQSGGVTLAVGGRGREHATDAVGGARVRNLPGSAYRDFQRNRPCR